MANHEPLVLIVEGRHYPKCKCGWFPMTHDGFDDEAAAKAAGKSHVRERADAKRARQETARRQRALHEAQAAARRRARVVAKR